MPSIASLRLSNYHTIPLSQMSECASPYCCAELYRPIYIHSGNTICPSGVLNSTNSSDSSPTFSNHMTTSCPCLCPSYYGCPRPIWLLQTVHVCSTHTYHYHHFSSHSVHSTRQHYILYCILACCVLLFLFPFSSTARVVRGGLSTITTSGKKFLESEPCVHRVDCVRGSDNGPTNERFRRRTAVRGNRRKTLLRSK
jgi:hypothetical protein